LIAKENFFSRRTRYRGFRGASSLSARQDIYMPTCNGFAAPFCRKTAATAARTPDSRMPAAGKPAAGRSSVRAIRLTCAAIAAIWRALWRKQTRVAFWSMTPVLGKRQFRIPSRFPFSAVEMAQVSHPSAGVQGLVRKGQQAQ
jgi:hypothetical protein